MSLATSISWCDATFNPWIGCAKVSPGCLNCYAEFDTRPRVLRAQGVETWGRGAARVRTAASTWKNPLAWARAVRTGKINRRLRVFSASLADWLDPEVPPALRAQFLELIWSTPELDWLLLTKRPELWRTLVQAAHDAAAFFKPQFTVWLSDWLDGRAPANVWAGCTVEDQPRATSRREHLQAIPACVRFVSYEPALEHVDWTGWGFIDWLIMGGESGSHARSLQVEWFCSSLYWCRAARVAPFVKQLGAHVFTQNANALDWPEETVFSECGDVPMAAARVQLQDGKGSDMAEFPEEFRIREFPTPRVSPPV